MLLISLMLALLLLNYYTIIIKIVHISYAFFLYLFFYFIEKNRQNYEL